MCVYRRERRMRDISGERGRERERENTFELQPTAPPTSCQRSPPFLNSFINTRTIGCIHIFLRKWFRVKAACPVCNKSLLEEGIFEVDPVSGTLAAYAWTPTPSFWTILLEGNSLDRHKYWTPARTYPNAVSTCSYLAKLKLARDTKQIKTI